jgi:hypothetical protein
MNGTEEYINYDYDNENFEFFYKSISLFKLSDILVNDSWEDGTGTLDLDKTYRLKIGIDEI